MAKCRAYPFAWNSLRGNEDIQTPATGGLSYCRRWSRTGWVEDEEEALSRTELSWAELGVTCKCRLIIIAHLAQRTVLVFSACLQGTVEMKAIIKVLSFMINCHD